MMETDPRLGGPRLYESSPELRHLRCRLELDDGTELLFTDVRRFGTAVLLEGRERWTSTCRRGSGIEPLSDELTPEALGRMAEGRDGAAEVVPADPDRRRGIGNIYADEALHRAELHPLSPAGSMKPEHCEALVEGIVDALETGLDERRRPSIDDYRDARGERGSMQDEFLVHTREGQAVPALRRDDRADRRRRPLDLLLPRVPGEAAEAAEAAQAASGEPRA